MYHIYIKRSAQKALSKIDKSERDRIVAKIKTLREGPRPSLSKKLKGRDAWRIRIGDYRVIYEIEDNKLVVLVVAVGHRSSIYRKFN